MMTYLKLTQEELNKLGEDKWKTLYMEVMNRLHPFVVADLPVNLVHPYKEEKKAKNVG